MDYRKYSNKAIVKLEKYGGECTITRMGEEVYNTETNTYEGEETVIKGKGILSNYSDSQINGTLILTGDRKLMCYLESEPIIDDVLTIGGIDYLVKGINPLNPDGSTVIYYNLQLRRK